MKGSTHYWNIPGWNATNDLDSDGYVNNTEFANLRDPNATARFRHMARAPVWYFTNRWVTYLGNSMLTTWVRDQKEM